MGLWTWIVGVYWAITELWRRSTMVLYMHTDDSPTLQIPPIPPVAPASSLAPPLPAPAYDPEASAVIEALPGKVERWTEPTYMYPTSTVVEDELGEWDPRAHRLAEPVLFRRVAVALLAGGELHVPTSRASFIDWAMDRVLAPV